MAKKDRNKRAARKARQAERERVAAARALTTASAPSKSSKSFFKKSGSAPAKAKTSNYKAVAKADRKGISKVTGYFSDVRTEMHQVTWPTRNELKNYSIAVIVMLIVFGAVLWLVDTGFVALLVQYTGLRG